jgi:hypothetical protein
LSSYPSINEDDLPISSSLKSFDLQIIMAQCDIYSMGLILRYMLNLHRFIFTLILDQNISPFIIDLINGQNLARNVNKSSTLKGDPKVLVLHMKILFSLFMINPKMLKLGHIIACN